MDTVRRANAFEEVRTAVSGAAAAVQSAADAARAAEEAQRRVTESLVALRDTCRRVADEWAAIAERLRRPLRVVLAETEEAARRADWHINAVMPQSIRRPFCRRKSRLLRSLGQAQLANARLRELLAEIVARFPDQADAAAVTRARLDITDADLDRIRENIPLLPFIRTAADGPDA